MVLIQFPKKDPDEVDAGAGMLLPFRLLLIELPLEPGRLGFCPMGIPEGKDGED